MEEENKKAIYIIKIVVTWMNFISTLYYISNKIFIFNK